MDPLPTLAYGRDGSAWLLVCDHAGNEVPQRLGTLGLSTADLNDHIGLDIGIWPVTQQVADVLGAQVIGQRYSRLVIDCNRRPGSSMSIPEVSDGRQVPGNAGKPHQGQRVAEIFDPYHAAIEASLDAKPAGLLCSMHSFTRDLAGHRRDIDIGVIYGPRSRLADAVFSAMQDCGLRVGRNVPYQIDFAGDHTLPVHGEKRGLDYVEIEICQDLIGDMAGEGRLAQIMSHALASAGQASRS